MARKHQKLWIFEVNFDSGTNWEFILMARTESEAREKISKRYPNYDFSQVTPEAVLGADYRLKDSPEGTHFVRENTVRDVVN